MPWGWDLSSQTRDPTCAPCSRSRVLTAGLPEKSPKESFDTHGWTVPWKKSHCVYQKPIISSEKENRRILWAEKVAACFQMGRKESESEEGAEAKAWAESGSGGGQGEKTQVRGPESPAWHGTGPRSLASGLRTWLAHCPQACRPTSLLICPPRRGASGQLIHKKGDTFSLIYTKFLGQQQGPMLCLLDGVWENHKVSEDPPSKQAQREWMPAGLLIIRSLELPDQVLERRARKSRISFFQAQCGAKRGLKPEDLETF